ncbi:hypothetical protein ES703_43621 [subsurface metagenome]
MMKEKKKAHGIQLLLQAIVRDPDGKIVSDTGQKPAKSFVIQFLEFIYGMATQFGFEATTVNNSEKYIYAGSTRPCSDHLRIDGGYDTRGIVVGTGDTAVDNEDYKLETQLTEGAGAGNISHGLQVIETTAVVGANVDLETKRSFTNNTGSTITVKEAGMYVSVTTAAGTEYFCIIRDTLTAPVPDKYSLTIIYTLRTTV